MQFECLKFQPKPTLIYVAMRKKVQCFVVTSVKISPLSRFQTPYHHLETQISLYHHHNPVDAGPWNISSWGSTQGSHHNCLIQFYTQSPCTSLQVTWVLPSSLSLFYKLSGYLCLLCWMLQRLFVGCWSRPAQKVIKTSWGWGSVTWSDGHHRHM